MLHLHSAVVPVSGAASGIGLAVCQLLRAEGATPLMLDYDAEALQTAVGTVYAGGADPSRHAHVVDVRDPDGVDACFAQILRDHGPVTHAVANAGVVDIAGLLEISNEQWHRVIDINQHGVMYFCRAAARQMVAARRGAIVNMASIAGLGAKPQRLAYTASKAPVVNMTRAMALDLGPHGIRVNAVAPGVTHTRSRTTSRWKCCGRARIPFRWAGWGNPRKSRRWCCSCCRTWHPSSMATPSWRMVA